MDATLELYHAVLAEHRNVGVCLQAYLYRTEKDLQAIIEAGGAVRLVKGAYKEPASVAYPKKVDVDASYLDAGEDHDRDRRRGARLPRRVRHA